jgi:hypothetical protein
MVRDGMAGIKHDPRHIDMPNEAVQPFGRPVLHLRCSMLKKIPSEP